jgi:hypothetical protein
MAASQLDDASLNELRAKMKRYIGDRCHVDDVVDRWVDLVAAFNPAGGA